MCGTLKCITPSVKVDEALRCLRLQRATADSAAERHGTEKKEENGDGVVAEK